MKRFFRRALIPMAAVAAVAATALPAEAYSFAPCNTSNTRVCYDEVRPTNIRLYVPRTVDDTVIASASAYLDTYNIPVGSGGVQIRCVTPVVNGVPADACDRAGFQLLNRVPLMTPIEASLVRAEPTYSVYVCEAELTVLAADTGLNRFPVLSVCHDFMVE